MAAELADAAWAEICKAARLTPDGEARSALAVLLFEEYPAFAYDRARWAAASKRAERMLKHHAEFAELYRQAWLPHLPVDQFQTILAGHASALTDVRTEADLWWLAMLRRRPEATWLAARAIRRANKGQKNQQREWLYHRLCGIWLDHFHAPGLAITLGGPLTRFILAAMRQVMPHEALPDQETVRDGIKRERDERANAAQLSFEFKVAVKKRGVD